MSIVCGPKCPYYSCDWIYWIYIALFGIGICRFCIWVDLPVQRRLCSIFVRNVRSPDIHECFRGLTGSQRTPGFGASHTYLFGGEADHWWESVKRKRDISALTWGEFDQIFQNKYFSKSVRDKIKADFLALRLGSTTVVEYERRFTELSRYSM